MRVHLRMLGCRLNQSEIDMMARQLEHQGHTIVDNAMDADQIIVNTCAVTQDATKSGRKLIREMNRQNQEAEITVTGCHSQISPQEIAVLPGVKRVVRNDKKDALVSQITGEHVDVMDLEPLERNQNPQAMRTRAFIKVQDGCDNSCTFCITTVARGDGISRDADEVIAEINTLHASGYQEAVLTGVHLGSYGHDWGDKAGLKKLVEHILNATDIPRVRISSLEPWDIADGFFALWKNPRLCAHLHLPLQSGCDATLKRMRRNTSQAEFRRIVDEARQHIPHLHLTSDVIVGFPGETDAEWDESLEFIKEMNFAGLHVFRYSQRAGTPATRIRGQVKNDIKKARSQTLRDLVQQWEIDFAKQYVSTKRPVLWEAVMGSNDDGFFHTGYTDNYIRVKTRHPRVLTNHITETRFVNYDGDSLEGQPIIEPVLK